jgi:hypothetical protein
MELPDEVWDYIKDFAFDWQRAHRLKLKKVLRKDLDTPLPNFCWVRYPEYERWTLFPPPHNTNEIIRDEYPEHEHEWWVPTPDLPLTSITWSPKGTGGWWCGYGWVKGGRL